MVPLLIAAAPAAAAQSPPACSFDTAAATRSVPVTIGLAPGRLRSDPGLLPDDYNFAVQAVRAHFTPPATVTLPVWARTAPPDPSPWDGTDLPRYGLYSDVVFRLESSGRLADTAVTVATASPELTASLIAAVRGADSAKEFSPPGDQVLGDSGTIVLRVVDWSKHQGPGVPLMRLDVPTIHVDSAARVRSQAPAEYPLQAFKQGLADTVVMLHVVTALGQADPATFRVVAGHYRDLALAAMQATVRSTFDPARVSGCAVPQEVLSWVAFTAQH